MTKNYYRSRVTSILRKPSSQSNAQSQNYAVAAALVCNKPVDRLTPLWQQSGMFHDESPVSLIAKDTIIECLHEDLSAVQVLLEDPLVSWRASALEVAFCDCLRHKVRLKIPRVNLFGTTFEEREISLCPRQVIEMPKDDNMMEQLSPGTAVICRDKFPVIDVFAHLDDGTKLLIQFSDSTYTNHSSKYPDLFTSKTKTNETVFQMFKRLTGDKTRCTAVLPENWYYVFVTTKGLAQTKLAKINASLPRAILVDNKTLVEWGARLCTSGQSNAGGVRFRATKNLASGHASSINCSQIPLELFRGTRLLFGRIFTQKPNDAP
eukprot:c12836_g1_i1.p1 GENE.c12836_g1_i1~~c12836_g1_i1.p1  ORF type:complete len:321 (+),score=42.78 c12836_g1_i1:851-1813(+)